MSKAFTDCKKRLSNTGSYYNRPGSYEIRKKVTSYSNLKPDRFGIFGIPLGTLFLTVLYCYPTEFSIYLNLDLALGNLGTPLPKSCPSAFLVP